MTITGQKVPRPSYKAMWNAAITESKSRKDYGDYLLTEAQKTQFALENANRELKGTDKLLLWTFLAALAEAAWIVILLARHGL